MKLYRPVCRLVGYVALASVFIGLSNPALGNAIAPVMEQHPGEIDSRFNLTDNGYWSGLVGPGNLNLKQLLLTPENKILVGGTFNSVNGVNRKHLARLESDGRLDLGFTSPFISWSSVSCLANCPDHKLLVAGTFSQPDGNYLPEILRLNANGSVDTSFQLKRDWTVVAMALDSQNRILISHSWTADNTIPFLRFLSNGDLDETFQPEYFRQFNHPTITVIKVCADGKILAAGYFDGPLRSLVRLNADGSLDQTFDGRLGYGNLRPSIRAVQVQSDGKILIGGFFTTVGDSPCTNLARLYPNGAFDSSFKSHSCNGWIDDIAVQSDQKVIATGTFTFLDGKTNMQGLARLLPDGTWDASFDLAPFRSVCDSPNVNQVSIDSSNRILLTALYTSDYYHPANLVYCLQTNGAVDKSFQSVMGAGSPDLASVKAQPDGSVFVAGNFTGVRDQACGGFARLSREARLLPGFRIPAQFRGSARTSVTLPGGSVIVAGSWDDNVDSGSWIIRFKSNGEWDPTWHYNSTATNAMNLIHDMSVAPDGTILVCGLDCQWRSAAQRLLSNGSLDPYFKIPNFSGSDDYGVRRVLAQPDGKILLCGEILGVNEVPASGVIRLNRDGTLDTTFKSGVAYVSDIALLPDSRILVAGSYPSTNPAKTDFLKRLNADGSLDPTFTNPDNVSGSGYALRVQPNGKILLGGWFEFGPNPVTHKLLVRFLPNGAIDPDFVQGQADGSVLKIDVTPDGTIFAVGSFSRYNDTLQPGIVCLAGDPVSQPLATRVVPIITRPGTLMRVTLALNLPYNFGSVAIEDTPYPAFEVKSISQNGVFDRATGKVKFGPFFSQPTTPLTYDILIPTNATGLLSFSGRASLDGAIETIDGSTQVRIVGQHPADRSPCDSLLSLSEITAYASAWKRGQSWPATPSPILQSYVTRAGYLWRSGEKYTLDPTIFEAPLFWVPTYPQIHVQMLNATPGQAVRTTAPGFVEGMPLTIQIKVQPPSGTLAFSVEESIPDGWTPGAIEGDATFDPVTRCLKWGPYFDSENRTLEYQVTPASVGQARQSLHGAVSYDGSDALISGDCVLSKSCFVRSANLNANGELILETQGLGSAMPVVEMSEDLTRWQEVPVQLVENGRIHVTIGRDAVANRFYRVRMD